MANFAKWYAFNRTRILAMKTAGGIGVFAQVLRDKTRASASTRCGTHLRNDRFLNVAPFMRRTETTWFSNFTR